MISFFFIFACFILNKTKWVKRKKKQTSKKKKQKKKTNKNKNGKKVKRNNESWIRDLLIAKKSYHAPDLQDKR